MRSALLLLAVLAALAVVPAVSAVDGPDVIHPLGPVGPVPVGVAEVAVVYTAYGLQPGVTYIPTFAVESGYQLGWTQATAPDSGKLRWFVPVEELEYYGCEVTAQVYEKDAYPRDYQATVVIDICD